MKNNRTSILSTMLILPLAGLCFSESVWAASPAPFTHHTLINSEGAGPFFHFPLTLEVYENSLSPGLGDLRVSNASGEMVPYSLTDKTDIPQPKRSFVQLRGFPIYSNEQSGNTGLQIRREENGALVSIEPAKPTITRKLTGAILDASHIKEPMVAMDISLSQYSQPFQNFSIEASNDLKNWQGVQDSASIAVLEQAGERIEQRVVELASLRAKYLRMTWLDPQFIPGLPKVTVTTSSMPQQPQPEMLWTVTISPSRDAKGDYLYNLGGSLPAERIHFILPQLNTLAPAQLLVRGHSKQVWRKVSDTVLYRLAAKGGESQSLDIELGGNPISELQLKLDPRGGGMGNQAPQLKIGIRPQQLVFLARGNGPFSLSWGQAGAITSALPLTTLVPAYRYQNGLPGNVARLEDNSKNSMVNRTANNPDMKSTEPEHKKKWILWSVLLAGAGLLLLMAWKLMRSGEVVKP